MAEEIVDVLVIGSGPGGVAVTKRLADLGAQVLCLEQGDWINRSDYPSIKPDWETFGRRGTFSSQHIVRENYPVVMAKGNQRGITGLSAVGGTAALHDGQHHVRFRPSDFRVRTLTGVADDWPIRYEDLVPYYEMHDIEIGMSGLAGDPANPPRKPRPNPPLAIGPIAKRMGSAFDKLGWYWWVCENAVPSRPHNGRPGCMQHGMCRLGCFHQVKPTPDVSYWPKALQKGARLKTWSRVREVTVDSQGRANGALYYDRDGNLHEQPARVVVVSCSGVGTPRLLLNSKSKLYPQGLANSTGVVGKFFMGHVWGSFDAIVEERMDGTNTIPLPSTCQHFYESDLSRGFAQGYVFLVHNTSGPLGYAIGDAVWGAEHHRSMLKHFPHHIGMSTLGDDLPEETNYVELDPDVKDPNGIPAPRVFYKYGENSLKMQAHAKRMGLMAMEATGGTEISYEDRFPSGSHLMGTARMGNDPKRSVVNAWNQAHDVKNLVIVDASSFTTGAPVNPTATIFALGLRAADGIWNRRREWS